MSYQIKADKIFIENDKHSSKARLYLAPNDEALLGGLGRLFIMVEAKSREKKIPQILEQIINELSEYYYHSPTKNTEAALETTAQYFNENIVDISGKNLKWVKDKISILIAGIQDDKLILTGYNQIKLWLFRDNKIHDVTAGQNQYKPTGKKILSQLISGKLKSGDVLLLTNNAIFDYFSDEKIKKTVTTLAPTQACAFFKNTLLDYKINVNFATIIIKFIKRKNPVNLTAQPTQVFQQNEEIKKEIELINESWTRRLVRKAKKIFTQQLQTIKNKFNKRGRDLAVKQNLTEEKRKSVSKTTAAADKATKGKINWLKENISAKLKTAKIAEYRLFVLIVIIAVLFSASLLIIKTKKETSQQIEKVSGLTTEINNKIDSIEAALIYKDKEKAQELLQETKQLLNSLKTTIDPTNLEQQKKYEQLSKKIETQINKIYQLETLSQLPILAKFDIQAESNIFLGPKNILYLTAQNSLYKVNSRTQALDEVAKVGQKTSKINLWEKNKLILSNEQNAIWLVDTNNYSLNKLSFNLPANDSRVVDINSYAKKIYVLDTGTNNIYKYRYVNGSFGEPNKWLQQKADLSQGKEILVDGNVWIVNQDGSINKFFKGKQEVFSLKGLYESLGKEIKLWTADDLNFLYIIDQEKNRVIIADKDGRVKRQLLGEGLEKILSAVPNQTESELYILTTQHVYKFGL